MRRNEIICDRCGAVLEQHGNRYTVHLGKVPVTRVNYGRKYDLCARCAGWLEVEMARGKLTLGEAREILQLPTIEAPSSRGHVDAWGFEDEAGKGKPCE